MFDVIIDDGLHYDETQVVTMENLWARVRPGGYYIIEDVTEWSRIPTSYRHRIELCTTQHEQLSKHPVDNLPDRLC